MLHEPKGEIGEGEEKEGKGKQQKRKNNLDKNEEDKTEHENKGREQPSVPAVPDAIQWQISVQDGYTLHWETQKVGCPFQALRLWQGVPKIGCVGGGRLVGTWKVWCASANTPASACCAVTAMPRGGWQPALPRVGVKTLNRHHAMTVARAGGLRDEEAW